MARLSNLAAAKPEKAKMVENTIIQMARFVIFGWRLLGLPAVFRNARQ